ncbi:hypothetical protein GCM10010168_82450 [Actinoplanes ianthinogenes]|nr:hypothetical protein GCM10010168_82450 [Actinoplanes ianthinogenes]
MVLAFAWVPRWVGTASSAAAQPMPEAVMACRRLGRCCGEWCWRARGAAVGGAGVRGVLRSVAMAFAWAWLPGVWAWLSGVRAGAAVGGVGEADAMTGGAAGVGAGGLSPW